MCKSTEFLKSYRKLLLVWGVLYSLGFIVAGTVGAVIVWKVLHA